jgi:DNA invertase Pin-like site-specific DNA recombinase
LSFGIAQSHDCLGFNETEGQMIVGYARTSTVEQEAGFEAQLKQLKAVGCEKVFSEKVSAVAATREQLEAALDFVREGDSFIVTKLDRLARSVPHLCEIGAKLEAKGVSLKALDQAIDTSTPTGRLMFNLLGSIAQFERELTRERMLVGIAKAKADGKYRGGAPTARAQADKVRALRDAGVRPAEIARQAGISRTSVYRVLGDDRPAADR